MSTRLILGDQFLTSNQKTMTSSLPVVIASDQTSLTVAGTVAEDAAVSGNPILIGGQFNTAKVAVDTDGDLVSLSLDDLGRVNVVGPAVENTTVVGNPILVGGRYDSSARTLGSGDAGAVALDPAGRVISTHWTFTINRNLDLDETGSEIKTGAGRIAWFSVHNLNTTDTRYLKLYDVASLTVGTSTPSLTFPIQAKEHFVYDGPPIPFATNIDVAATTGLADNDTGAPSANEVILNVMFE